jgi:arsenate reductase (thioredoxin)
MRYTLIITLCLKLAIPNSELPASGNTGTLYPYIREYVRDFSGEFSKIPEERRHRLDRLASDLSRLSLTGNPVQLLFLDTRQAALGLLAPLWLEVAFTYYDLPRFSVYSGGLFPDKFNHNALFALERAGLIIYRTQTEGTENFVIKFAFDEKSIVVYPRKYDHRTIPRQGVYVCTLDELSEANIPEILRTPMRLSLIYFDPELTETNEMAFESYDRLCRQFAIEMFYVCRALKSRESQATR